jgi:hypothetical protein
MSDPIAQLAVVLLALFGQMERTYTLERAAHARVSAYDLMSLAAYDLTS